MDQTFGLVIPRLAMRSDMLFDALLKLCTTSYEAGLGHSTSTNSPLENRSSQSSYPIEHRLEQSKMWEVKLWSIITAVERFIFEPPPSWEDDTLWENNFLHIIYTQISESSPLHAINQRMLWLLVRLSK